MFEKENELLICLKIQEPEVTATLSPDENSNQRSVVDSDKIM